MHSDSAPPGVVLAAARSMPFVFRAPTPSDAASIHGLVAGSPPLDLNSTYAYLLVGLHFADTSVVAEHDRQVAGFVSAYLKPSQPDVLFVWQVAVGVQARGLGIGRRMLRHLLARPACSNVQAIETTITPSNGASWRLFRALARDMAASVNPIGVFDSRDVGGAAHEEERLIRISPVSAVPHGGQ